MRPVDDHLSQVCLRLDPLYDDLPAFSLGQRAEPVQYLLILTGHNAPVDLHVIEQRDR